MAEDEVRQKTKVPVPNRPSRPGQNKHAARNDDDDVAQRDEQGPADDTAPNRLDQHEMWRAGTYEQHDALPKAGVHDAADVGVYLRKRGI